MVLQPARRNRICLPIGLGAIALFLVLRGFNLYGDPNLWSLATPRSDGRPGMPTVLSFLNTSKYPASLLFLLMTLGPTIALIPLLEKVASKRSSLPLQRGLRGDKAAPRKGLGLNQSSLPLIRGGLGWGLIRWITVFGRVPFFYYVLHIPLIHVLAIGVSLVREGRVNPWLFANHPMGNPPPPEGYTWSLPTLYFVWALTILILYFPCRWFAGLKARRRDWWLSYL